MNQPHKHAALIKLWADDGARIEKQRADGTWAHTEEPLWSAGTNYRVAPPPPPAWQTKLRQAVAEGKLVQLRDPKHHTWEESTLNHIPQVYKFRSDLRESDFRIVDKPRPAWKRNLIDAAKAGMTIQFNAYENKSGTWVDSSITFALREGDYKRLDASNYEWQYRVKPTVQPEPKPAKVTVEKSIRITMIGNEIVGVEVVK